MTEMLVMEMPGGRAMRTSPRASGHMAEPSAEVPVPAARTGVGGGGCTALRKIPFRKAAARV
jgi:hypothetical protein